MRKRGMFLRLSVAMVMCLAVLVSPLGNLFIDKGLAAVYPGTRRALTAADNLDDHTVYGVQPPGTTVNLFNYSTGRFAGEGNDLMPKTDNNAIPSTWNNGINQNKLLVFGDSMVGAGYWNLGCGAGRPWAKIHTNMKGIVEPTLGADGYPNININNARQPLPDATGTLDNWSTGARSDVALLHRAEVYNAAATVANVNAARALSTGILQNAGFTVNGDGTVTGDGDKSLAYLFDSTENANKEVYENATGLFQIDDEGYYYYYARQNFAELNTNADGENYFTLYDGPAVWRTDAGYNSTNGQFDGDQSLGNFFPFNRAEDVFDSIQTADKDGNPTDILTSSESITNNNNAVKADHHMGMSLQVDFRQPINGTINNGSAAPVPMTFEFSGDDDVWIFIDDVLVLDIGGIHSELYGTIDFSTGDVYLGQSWRTNGSIPKDTGKTSVVGNNTTMAVDYHTLRELFQAAQGDKFNAAEWNGNTFSSNTAHTLKMFYLERGNYDSSLALRFNLQNRLYQEIKKVDQNGNPIPNVEFQLYAAEYTGAGPYEDYTASADDFTATSGVLATMTTDENGVAQFWEYDALGERQPFNFIDRYTRDNIKYYILKESKTPPGYRTLPQDIVLRFDRDNALLIVANRWTTGAYSSFTSYITGNSFVAYGQFNNDGSISQKQGADGKPILVTDDMKQKGLIVAVPMLYQPDMERPELIEDRETGVWVAAYGSNVEGYSTIIPKGRTAEDWRKAVLEAALRQSGRIITAHNADEVQNVPRWFLSWDDEFRRLTGELRDLPGNANRYQLAGDTAGKDMKMVYFIIDPNVLTQLGIDVNATSAEKYDALGAYVDRQIAAGKSIENIVNTIYNVTSDTEGSSGKGVTLLNVDQFLREFRSLVYIPNELRELRVWKVDENGNGVNGVEFNLYNRTTNEVAATGKTATVDGIDGVLIFRPFVDRTVPPGYANMVWASSAHDEVNDTYYLKEMSAPAGYELNPTEIPVIVGIYSIYADAGTEEDGISVMAGVGKLAQTMIKYASDGQVNITLRDIKAVAQTQPSGAFNLNGWSDMPLEDTVGNIARSLNLHYGENNVVDYGLHDEDGGHNYYPYFVTDTGYIRTRVTQNPSTLRVPVYGADANNTALWSDLGDTDITSLFSLLNTVVVSDKKETPDEIGSLAVRKTIDGAAVTAADYNLTFNFKVEFKDADGAALTGNYYFYGTDKSGYLKSGDTLPLHHDEEIVILGLPAGTEYTVTETDANSGDWKSIPTNGIITGDITADEIAYAEMINYKGAVEPGNLKVSKTVTGAAGDTAKDFTFTVTLDDNTISGAYGDMTFAGGTATFTLKHNESKTATGIPAGTGYTVTESDNDGYTVTKTGDVGDILPEETAEAAFENNKQTPDPGNLKVSKTVTGTAGDTTKDFKFTVTLDDTDINGTYGDMTFTDGVASFTLKHNQSKTAEGLPAGVGYTVTESDNDGYTVTKTDDTGEIVTEETAEAKFTNNKEATEPKTGSLVVSKTVTGTAGEKTKDFAFTVTLDDTDVNGKYGDMTFTDGVATFTLKHNQSKTAEGLPAGVDYTVTESDNDGYTVTKTDDTGTIAEDETANAVFVNNKELPKLGNLTVRKTVTGNLGETDKDFKFTVTLDDTDINGTYGDMTFTDGVAEFTLRHTESKTAAGLPDGVGYTVEEEFYVDYETTSFGHEGTIAVGETANAVFVNNREDSLPDPDKSNLTVSKNVTGAAGETDKDFTFTVTLDDTNVNGEYGDMTFKDGTAVFTLRHGQSKSAKNLPAALGYTVTESDNENYDVTSVGDKGTLIAYETMQVVFINNREQTPPTPSRTGNLTVTKTVTGDGGDKTKSFKFTAEFTGTGTFVYNGQRYTLPQKIEFTLSDGQSVTFYNLPVGTRYTVNESDNEGYTVTKSGDNGTIEAGRTASASFVNHKGSDDDYTSVTVRKVWVLDNGGKKTDAVTAALYKDGALYAQVELSEENGWTHTWTELEKGHTWTVQELNVPSGFKSTVKQDDAQSFTVTNDDIPENPPVPPKPDIPQTGMNRWPVWLLTAAGCAALIIGVFEKRRRNDKHES